MTKYIKRGEYQYKLTDFERDSAFGKIYKGLESSSNTPVCIKEISMKTIRKQGKELIKALKNEKEVLTKLTNPNISNITKFYDCCETSNNLYIITGYNNNGTLRDKMTEKLKSNCLFSENEMLKIVYQIAKGLAELHRRNIVHRDLKLENILVHNDKYRVGNFHFAKVTEDQFESRLGTPFYLAPEIYLEEEKLTSKVDIWALGCIAHHLVVGDFRGFTDSEPDKVNREYQMPAGIVLKRETSDLLNKCFVKNSRDRVGIQEIVNHPAFDCIK